MKTHIQKTILNNQRIIILLIVFAIGIFYAFTLRTGHNWGDDFALFMLHARNISEGRPYGDTGFIYNPLATSYSPQYYPPGFPLIIAPLYAIFGIDYLPYKVLIIFFFMGLLWLIYDVIKDKVSFGLSCIIIIIFGLSPYLWELSDNVLSDIPATFFIFLAISLELKRTKKNTLALACLEGLSIYMAYACRTTGIVLLPALVYRFFIEKKRQDRYFIIVLIAFVIPAMVQGFFMPDGKGYMGMMIDKYGPMHFDKILFSILTATNKYIADLQGFSLLAPVHVALNTLLTTFCFGLFITGWYLHARKHFSFIDIFLLLFTGLIFIWPFFQGIRYLLPLLPFYVYFIFVTLSHIDIKWFRQTIFITFLLTFISIYIGFYAQANYSQVQYGPEDKNSLDVFSFIKTHTGENDLIMSSKPRVFCLYTGRKGIVYPDQGDPGLYYKCLGDNKVNYIVTGLEWNSTYKGNALDDTIKFTPVYANETFSVFKVNP